jgi:pimeloyl-ACP methyl ester carboxylesterase
MMGVFRFGVRAASPFICRDPRFPDMMDRDLSRTTVQSFLRSIASLRRTDLRPLLSSIKIPVMGMYGDKDNIVHPLQWKPLSAGVTQNRIERFPRAGHFIMMDDPEPFMQKLKQFLDEESPTI